MERQFTEDLLVNASLAYAQQLLDEETELSFEIASLERKRRKHEKQAKRHSHSAVKVALAVNNAREKLGDVRTERENIVSVLRDEFGVEVSEEGKVEEMRNDSYNIEDCQIVKATAKAVLVESPNLEAEQWVPQSCIHEDSEVWKEGQDRGTLTVKRWWAVANGLCEGV